MEDNQSKKNLSPAGLATEQSLDLKSAIDRLGSEKLVRKVAGVFLINAPVHLGNITDAISKGDTKKLEMAAHTLVSSMAYLSAGAATSAALKLEHMGRDGKMKGSQEVNEALKAEVARLESELAAFLAHED